MTNQMLEALSDEELQEMIARGQTILKMRDDERKAKAIADARAMRAKTESDARALLASVGLPFKAVAPKKRRSHAKRGDNATAQAPVTNAARKAG